MINAAKQSLGLLLGYVNQTLNLDFTHKYPQKH